jgi:hypothetical protein
MSGFGRGKADPGFGARGTLGPGVPGRPYGLRGATPEAKVRARRRTVHAPAPRRARGMVMCAAGTGPLAWRVARQCDTLATDSDVPFG